MDIKNDTEFVVKIEVSPPLGRTYTVLIEPEEWVRVEEDADVYIETIYKEVESANKEKTE